MPSLPPRQCKPRLTKKKKKSDVKDECRYAVSSQNQRTNYETQENHISCLANGSRLCGDVVGHIDINVFDYRQQLGCLSITSTVPGHAFSGA